jgi:hypothetical protein
MKELTTILESILRIFLRVVDLIGLKSSKEKKTMKVTKDSVADVKLESAEEIQAVKDACQVFLGQGLNPPERNAIIQALKDSLD